MTDLGDHIECTGPKTGRKYTFRTADCEIDLPGQSAHFESREHADQISVGDKVAYSREFLRSTGEHTGPIPFARGVVTGIKKYSGGFAIATVDWDTDAAPESVNLGNLVKVDRMHLEPN
jgi:hypothetical protein